jgi:HAD superfamily hydrolase (TIGR01549 family)
MYKLAVFDIDGTLIDTERTGVESLVLTIRQLLGKEVSYEEAYKAFGIPSSRVAGLYGYEDAKRFGKRWEENFIALSHHINPFPGVLDALRSIKANSMATGVVTSRNRMEFDIDDYLREMVPYLDYIVCSEDTNHHKPHPEPLLLCIDMASKSLGVPVHPEEVLFLGDTDHDFACARDAGCDFALADWKSRGWQGIPARFKFSCAEEMKALLIK